MVLLCLLMYWVSERVVSGDVGISPNNIALDSQSNPYILVLEKNENVSDLIFNLVLYSKNDGNWIADTFETYADEPLGINGDIVVDCFDRIWVVYSSCQQTGSTKYLVVACRDTNDWTKDTVDTGYTFNYQTVATDSDGNPHITYDNYLGPPHMFSHAFYAYYDGYTWAKEAIDTTVVNYDCSIDVDSGGNPHIAYFHRDVYSSQDYLWRASKESNEWVYDEIDTCDSWWWPTSIRIGVNNLPRIAYTDPGGGLKYAYNTGVDWTTEIVELPTAICGFQKALDIDSLGRPYIVFEKDEKTWIAYKTGSWDKDLLPESGIKDSYGSVRIDNKGVIHITRVSWSTGYREIYYIHGNVGIEESTAKRIARLQVYPNPFIDVLKIRFSSPDHGMVTVKLYDITGRLVEKIYDGNAKIGTNEITVRSEKLPAGVYFMSFEAEDYKKTRKLLLIR